MADTALVRLREHLEKMETSVKEIWEPLLLRLPESEYAKTSYYATSAYCDGIRNAIAEIVKGDTV